MSLTPVYSTIIDPYSSIFSTGYHYFPNWETLLFSEQLNSIWAFYYTESDDCFHLITGIKTDRWPSWDYCNMSFSATTGQYIRREVYVGGTILWNIVYTKWFGPGLNNVFYKSEWSILQEVDARTFGAIELGWSSDIRTWNPPVNTQAGPFIINRFDDIIGVVNMNTGGLKFYSSLNTTPILTGELVCPSYNFTGIAFEDRSRCWLVTAGGVLLKLDYVQQRWELMSSVDALNPLTKTFKVAYDTKRKRVGVFAWLPDLPNGTCQSTISTYRPIYQALGLTDPVPVQKLIAGTNIKFVSHLYGGAGEGVATNMADTEILSPAHGRMTSASALIELNGAVPMKYIAPPTPGTDTLQISVGGL